MTNRTCRRYVQPATGQLASLYFDEHRGTWVLDLFKPGLEVPAERIALWSSLEEAAAALAALRFEQASAVE